MPPRSDSCAVGGAWSLAMDHPPEVTLMKKISCWTFLPSRWTNFSVSSFVVLFLGFQSENTQLGEVLF